MMSIDGNCHKRTESEDGTDISFTTTFSDNVFVNTIGSFDPSCMHSSSVHLDVDLDPQTRLDAKILHKEFPDMTFAESYRFRSLRSMKKARKKLKSYREWRKKYVDDIPIDSLSFDNEKEVWDYAVSHSLRFFPDVNLEEKLPRFARMIGKHPNRTSVDSDNIRTDSICGKRILYFLPMMIDSEIAPLELYALTFAIYFYLTLDRYGFEDNMCLLDARLGKGWPNPSPFSFIPLAKMISKHMDWFPQRLDKIFCSPVPLAASIGWKVVKRFLKPVVVAKINIYWGSSSINSLPPKEFEEDYFEQSTMSFLEKERRSEFC